MELDDEAKCRDLVCRFCSALNEWERTYYIVQRIANGKFVSDSKRQLVENLSEKELLEVHAQIYERYIVPRERKYGSNPGVPNCWGDHGSFFDVSENSITSVSFRDNRHAEVITNWGYMLPGGKTMFVLKRVGDRWLIDSLKTYLNKKWEVAIL